MTERTDLYRYDLFEKALDDYVAGTGSNVALRSLRKLKFSVLASAWIDFSIWHPDTDKRQAMSWAWEDLAIAFKGYGESSTTGAVVELWTMLGTGRWPEFRKMLNETDALVEKRTKKTVARRYLKKHRMEKARSPKEGFELPAIVPICGRRLQDWAVEHGLDPADTEQQLVELEELERMGMLNLKGPDATEEKGSHDCKPAKGPSLTLLSGGLDSKAPAASNT